MQSKGKYALHKYVKLREDEVLKYKENDAPVILKGLKTVYKGVWDLLEGVGSRDIGWLYKVKR